MKKQEWEDNKSDLDDWFDWVEQVPIVSIAAAAIVMLIVIFAGTIWPWGTAIALGG